MRHVFNIIESNSVVLMSLEISIKIFDDIFDLYNQVSARSGNRK
jgi:hypothetical protein